MANFQDLLNQLRNPGEDGLPDNFGDELEQAYTDELGERDARIGQLTTSRTEADAEINRLKLQNYDLRQNLPATDNNEGGDNSGDDKPEARGIARLFR